MPTQRIPRSRLDPQERVAVRLWLGIGYARPIQDVHAVASACGVSDYQAHRLIIKALAKLPEGCEP